MANRKKNAAIKKAEAEATVCYYCGRRFEDTYHKTKVVEHFYPLSKGGTNAPDNKEISCRDCDILKGNRVPDAFKQSFTDIASEFHAIRDTAKRRYKKFGYTKEQLQRIAYAIEVFDILH